MSTVVLHPRLAPLVELLKSARRQLLDVLETVPPGLARRRPRVNGSALGRLFLGQHERRHTVQAREVLGMLRSVALATVITAAASTAAAAQTADPLPFPAMAARIVAALQPAAGERAILRTDSVAMPGLVAPLRAALEQAGVEVSVLGFGAGVDLAAELARSSIYLYLPLAPGTILPPPEVDLLGKWLDSGRGRQIHFHWTGITTGTDGLPVPVPPGYDRLHLAALEVNEGTLRHRLTRAAELLRGREIRVATPAGTDLRFRIGDRPICVQDGNAARDAVSGKPLRIDKEIELPAGVVRVAPPEETVAGTLVIPMLRIGDDTARMVQLDFAGGRVTDVRAEWGADAVRALLAKSPALANFRELGIGFNPALVVPPGQPVPYAGYGAGMVRLSLGDNRELGGQVSGGDVRWLFFPDATVTAGTHILVAGGRLAL